MLMLTSISDLLTHTHFATNPSMSTIVKLWGISIGSVQHDAPLGEVRGRVLKKIVQQNLNQQLVSAHCFRRIPRTSLNSRPLLSYTVLK